LSNRVGLHPDNDLRRALSLGVHSSTPDSLHGGRIDRLPDSLDLYSDDDVPSLWSLRRRLYRYAHTPGILHCRRPTQLSSQLDLHANRELPVHLLPWRLYQRSTATAQRYLHS
jgi:hypothetical protein